MKYSFLLSAFFLVSLVVLSAFFVSPQAFSKAKKLTLTSRAFVNSGEIPEKYAYTEISERFPKRQNISLPLEWDVREDMIEKVKSFAVSIIDLHPKAKKFVHLMAINIPWDARSLEEGDMLMGAPTPVGVYRLINGYGFEGYGGPNPPENGGYHRYKITLYALKAETIDAKGDFSTLTIKEFEKLFKGKIVAKASLVGKFKTMVANNEGKTCDQISAEDKKTHTIDMTDDGFPPNRLFIKRCDKVVFLNKGQSSHWPASDVHPTHSNYPKAGGCIGSAFDACDGVKPGDSYSFVFEEKGTWDYHDHMNPSLKGTIVVE